MNCCVSHGIYWTPCIWERVIARLRVASRNHAHNHLRDDNLQIYLSEKQNKLSNSRKQKQGLQQVISVVETANFGNFAPFLASKL